MIRLDRLAFLLVWVACFPATGLAVVYGVWPAAIPCVLFIGFGFHLMRLWNREERP